MRRAKEKAANITRPAQSIHLVSPTSVFRTPPATTNYGPRIERCRETCGMASFRCGGQAIDTLVDPLSAGGVDLLADAAFAPSPADAPPAVDQLAAPLRGQWGAQKGRSGGVGEGYAEGGETITV